MRRLVNAVFGGVLTFGAALAAVATVPASAGCKSCTTMECGGVGISTSLVFTAASLEPDAKLTVCRGVDCKSASVSVSAMRVGPDRDGAYATPVACGGAGASCAGAIDPSTGNVSLYVQGIEVAEGTALSVRVTNPDGAVLASHEGVVAYYSDEPNGPGCEPTCTEARF